MAKYNSDRLNFASEPLSSYKVPEFKTVRNVPFIHYGEDNNYPQYLCDLFNRSAKHNAILTAKQKWTFGKGLKLKPKNDVRQVTNATKLLKNPNPFESLNDIFNKTCLDKRLYGGYSLQIIWDKGRVNIARIFHIDFSKVRSNVDNTMFYYCNDWNDRKEKIVEFLPFNPDRREGLQLYYYREYRPALKTYPLPDYIAAIPYIEVDVEVANYHRANLQNEFFFGGILNFNNGVPEPDEQRDLVRRINGRHKGTDNAGRWIINFSDGSDKAPNVIPIQPNDLDKQFETLNKTVQEEIFVAHRVTSPMLLGVKTEGQLGGRTEMVDAFKLFNLNEIEPDQKHFEELFNYFAMINGVPDAYEVEPLSLPMPTLTESVLEKVATREELRELVGLPKETTLQKEGFSWQDEVSVFAEFGEGADNFNELSRRSVTMFDEVDAFNYNLDNDESELMEFGFAEIEANTPNENKVLEYVKNNPVASKASIARGTGLSESEVESVINTLKRDSVLSMVEGAWSINNKRPSKSLVNKIADEIKRLEVRYKYTGPKDSKNREFCAALLDLNRLYTRKEIDAISKRVGRNVWTKRGGWQTVKGTDIHLPFCRHTWSSILTQRKNG